MEDAEVFAWALESDGPQFAHLSGAAIGRGTNAACFDAEFTGGWLVLHWEAWSNAPAGGCLYAVVSKDNADSDGLTDGDECNVYYTNPNAWASDTTSIRGSRRGHPCVSGPAATPMNSNTAGTRSSPTKTRTASPTCTNCAPTAIHGLELGDCGVYKRGGV